MHSLVLPASLTALLLIGCSSTKTTDDAPANGATAATDAEAAKAAAAPDKDGADAAGGARAPEATADEPKPEKPKEKSSKEKEEESEEEKKDKAQKKWDETLKDLKESKGFFTTWHDEGKLLLELDAKALGREFLYWGHLNTGLGNNAVYRGAMLYDSPWVLHFEKRGKGNVVLVADNTAYLDGGDPREEQALRDTLSDGILRAFEIAAELEHEKRVLIDLGEWFKSDNLRVAQGISGRGFSPNPKLSLVEGVKAFPRNVEITLDMVYTSGNTGGGNSTMADARGVAVKVNHSLVALPDPGYKPRAFDQRVGFFYSDRKDLFKRDGNDPVVRYINRWRLVKKDPTAEVSDPVQSIVYWIDNNTPKEFRQAVREGIESWDKAFRKAGFTNGILAKQMPDDADWDPADVRYAVVQWSEDENVGFAIGPSRQDPRTGETFDADITMQANFLNTYAQRFDTWLAERSAMTKDELREEWLAQRSQVLPEDGPGLRRDCLMMSEERAMQVAFAAALLPMLDPDTAKHDFLHAMIREVTAHEVGHTLGMRHNFKASVLHGLDKLHDKDVTTTEGITGSFMDYPAVNIAAPGSTQGEYFQSCVGPADIWTIEYGYTEFGNADQEKAGLEKIAARSHLPGHEFGTDEDSMFGDPYTEVWDMGSDPVAYARSQIALVDWGLEKMLERAAEPGDEYIEYARYFSMFNSHLQRQYMGLDRFLGGYQLHRHKVGQTDGNLRPIEPVDPALQQAALDVMIEEGLHWKGGIPNEQRLLLANRKYGPFQQWFDFWSFDPLPRLVNGTRFVSLLSLMDVWLYERLDGQAKLGAQTPDMRVVADRVFTAVWPDVAAGRPDEFDLWTQSDYVRLAISGLEQDTTPTVTALFHELLGKAEASLTAYAGSADRTVAAHGKWLGDEIKRWRARQIVEF